MLLRKEVIQPHLPIRLPCYDFTPVAGFTFDGSLPCVHFVVADVGCGRWDVRAFVETPPEFLLLFPNSHFSFLTSALTK